MNQILRGDIEFRRFPQELLPDGWEGPRYAPQLIVQGLSYPDLIRASLAAHWPSPFLHVVEDGRFRLTPEMFEEEEHWQEEQLRFEDRDIDPVLNLLLYVCSCGYPDCYCTIGAVRRFALNGEGGFLIEAARNNRLERPYPVPPVFVPWMAWVGTYYHQPEGPVKDNSFAQPTAALHALLGADARDLLKQYWREQERPR